MKAIELRDWLDEIVSEDEACENYGVFMTGMGCNDRFIYSIDNLSVNAESNFGKIIELF